MHELRINNLGLFQMSNFSCAEPNFFQLLNLYLIWRMKSSTPETRHSNEPLLRTQTQIYNTLYAQNYLSKFTFEWSDFEVFPNSNCFCVHLCFLETAFATAFQNPTIMSHFSIDIQIRVFPVLNLSNQNTQKLQNSQRITIAHSLRAILTVLNKDCV